MWKLTLDRPSVLQLLHQYGNGCEYQKKNKGPTSVPIRDATECQMSFKMNAGWNNSGGTYTLGSPVWSCRWSVGTLTDSPGRTQATQSSERLPYRPSGWSPAVPRSLPVQSRLLCSGNQEEILWVCIVLQGASLASHEAWTVFVLSQNIHTHTFDLTTLMRFSFKVTSTALSLAATVLLSWLVTGSRLLEIAGEKRNTTRTTNTTVHRKSTKTRSANLPDVTLQSTSKYLLYRRWSEWKEIIIKMLNFPNYISGYLFSMHPHRII